MYNYIMEQFVDMNNQTDPIQLNINFIADRITPNYLRTEYVAHVAQNEGIFEDDVIGMFRPEPGEFNWLTIDSVVPKTAFVNDKSFILGNGSYTLFDLQYTFKMSDKKITYLRRSYSLLDLLGNFGGFNGSITMILGFIMSYYAKLMYQAATSYEFGTSKNNKIEHAEEQRLRSMHEDLSKGKNQTLEPKNLEILSSLFEWLNNRSSWQVFLDGCSRSILYRLCLKNKKNMR